jgi:hypothetical protein
MALRIGVLLLTPQAFLLPFAWAFFVLTTRRNMIERLPGVRAIVPLSLATLLGVAGAVGYARLAEHLSGVTGPTPWLHFGSLGGYVGALAGMALWARAMGISPLAASDCAAPGIMQGATVARIGCLFTGCCGDWAHGIALPFPWAGLDLFACLLTMAALNRSTATAGSATLHLLITYGVLRFFAEFLREQPGVLGALTAGQVACMVMVCAGVVIQRRIRQRAE